MRVDRIGSQEDVSNPVQRGHFTVDETETEVVFNVLDRPGIQGSRFVEFQLVFDFPSAWVPPVTDPALEETLGQAQRLTLVIMDDESPYIPPYLLTPVRPPGAPLLWPAIGLPGRYYAMEASLDFAHWDSLETNASPSGLLDFWVQPTNEWQFFRLRELGP